MIADADLIFMLGLVVGFFAIPSLVSAYSDSKSLKASTIALMVGAGLIALAVILKPEGYRLNEAPLVIFRVIGRFIH